MPGKYNYQLQHKYPHLIGEDTDVWSRFIQKNPYYFDTVDYDIKVGTGAETNTIPDETSRRYWAMLTKKRIDVIGWKNNFVTIIEVKKRVTLATLGQILGYRFLYHREHPELELVKTLIICSTINHDDIDVLSHYGIQFIVV